MISSNLLGSSGFSRTGAVGFVQDGIEKNRGSAPPKGQARSPSHKAPRQKRNVAYGVQILTPRLLRGHVGDRSQRRTGLVRFSAVVTRCLPDFSPPTRWTFARPKSRTLACPRLVTKIFAGLMSRWTMPSACAASRASAISIASESNTSFQRPPGNAILQRHAIQKLHGDKGCRRADHQFRRSCRYWDDSVQRRPWLRGETSKGLRVLGYIIGQELEGHKAAELISSAL